MSFTRSSGGDHCSAMGTASGNPVVATGTFTLRGVIPGRSEWSTCFDLEASVDGQRIPQRYHCGEPVDDSPSAQRMQARRQANPRISTPDPVLRGAMEASARDLGALRIEDPEHSDCPVDAAGAPWFMALSGRDSLLTGWMSPALDLNLALCTLLTLACVQGTKVDPPTGCYRCNWRTCLSPAHASISACVPTASASRVAPGRATSRR